MVKAITVWESKSKLFFPEINYDNIDKIRGMDICINTSASNNEDAKALLEVLNFHI